VATGHWLPCDGGMKQRRKVPMGMMTSSRTMEGQVVCLHLSTAAEFTGSG